MTLFNNLEQYIPYGPVSKLSKFQKLILVLMKLRLHVPVIDIGYRFSISPSTVSKIFKDMLHVLFVRLSPLVRWPDRDIL